MPREGRSREFAVLELRRRCSSKNCEFCMSEGRYDINTVNVWWGRCDVLMMHAVLRFKLPSGSLDGLPTRGLDFRHWKI